VHLKICTFLVFYKFVYAVLICYITGSVLAFENDLEVSKEINETKNLSEQIQNSNIATPPSFEFGLSIYPKLLATSQTHTSAFEDDMYELDKETMGLGLSLYYMPTEKWHGFFSGAGLDYYPNRKIDIQRGLDNTSVKIAGSNAHLLIGYRVWRFYAGGGIQYALFDPGQSDVFDISRSIGLRTMAGVDIFSWLKIESFYGFHRSIARVKEEQLRSSREPGEYDISYGAYGVYARFILTEMF
jgi:hypothetical protein